MKNRDLPPRLIREAEGVAEIAANLEGASDEELGLALEWLEARKLKKTEAWRRVLAEAMARPEAKDDVLADFQIRAMQDAQEPIDVCQLYRLAKWGDVVARFLEEAVLGRGSANATWQKGAAAALSALRGRGK